MPSQYEFDAMNDNEYFNFWDKWLTAQLEQANSEAEIDEALAKRHAAYDARFN